MVVTVLVENLTDKLIKETFPVIGTVTVPPKSKKRIPLDVAKVWADPNRYDPVALRKLLGDEAADPENLIAPIKILESLETPSFSDEISEEGTSGGDAKAVTEEDEDESEDEDEDSSVLTNPRRRRR